jgi:purine-nucleoside phosphorylase
MSKGTTPRAIRISDELWQEAKAVAERRSETISDVVRVALELYITAPDADKRGEDVFSK